ncbi:MarR family winged helix-turn-helix transcriptional regulator [Qipengyuania flava]|uniref:MarR family winged helix-turn-helix transcriptional regulator n=1 Tax=Qipengyuania flava TaxID=192812 RepID=UPI001C636878|nr:MarR family transcriptional regulator [Qipengyuania flava]QYJ08117.1 MarR family transcriptional regulator [Qipengyuania flava]
MSDYTANLLGVVSLAIANRIEDAAREILNHVGESPAAIVVIGYGFGPTNEQLRRTLNLSHPGAVRLVDRLAADGLVERRKGEDKRSVALHLTEAGHAKREALLKGRLAAIRPMLDGLSPEDDEALAGLLHKMLTAMDPPDAERCRLCRLCDDSVCHTCPIPADFREEAA